MVRDGEKSDMKMFLGEYQPNITEGSRIALPKKFRDQIQNTEIILTRGFEECVFLYDKSDWLVESQKYISTPISDSKSRDLKRYLFASATECAVDSQGRFVLPTNLKDYAKMHKKICIIGAGDHIELWDDQLWQEHLEKISRDLSF